MLITPFDPWHSSLCTCPPKYNLSPYTGCSHGCLYCYASGYIRAFDTPREKKDFLCRLEKEVPKLPQNTVITMANSSDPYQPLEQKLYLTRAALAALSRCRLKTLLVTKSSLITRDIDILKTMPASAAISITTPDAELAKKIEPRASTPLMRLRAVEQLSKYIPVSVRIDPLIYPVTTPSLETLVENIKNAGAMHIIASTYKTKPDNFKRMLHAFPGHKTLWHTVYNEAGEKKGGYCYLPKTLRYELLHNLRAVTLAKGLAFSCCREGFPELNTTACDGSLPCPAIDK